MSPPASTRHLLQMIHILNFVRPRPLKSLSQIEPLTSDLSHKVETYRTLPNEERERNPYSISGKHAITVCSNPACICIRPRMQPTHRLPRLAVTLDSPFLLPTPLFPCVSTLTDKGCQRNQMHYYTWCSEWHQALGRHRLALAWSVMPFLPRLPHEGLWYPSVV